MGSFGTTANRSATGGIGKGNKRVVAVTDRDWFDTQHGAMAIAPSRNAPSGSAAVIDAAKAFAASSVKKEYDYADPNRDPPGNAGVARQRARDARAQAPVALTRERDAIESRAAGVAGRGLQGDGNGLPGPGRLPDGTTEAVRYGRAACLSQNDPGQRGSARVGTRRTAAIRLSPL